MKRARLSTGTIFLMVLLASLGSRPAWAQVVQDGPTSPSALAMFLPGGTTPLPAASWIARTAADLRFAVQVTGGAVTPQVEVEPARVPFTNQPNFTGRQLTASGTASVQVTGLVGGKTYHWQARAVDGTGMASQWVPFSRSVASTDLGVDLTAPSRPAIRSATNPRQARWYHTRVETMQWRAADPLSGIKGYAWTVSRNPRAVPGGVAAAATSLRLTSLADGIWYVGLRAQDRAGNWSPTATYRLQLDRLPARLLWLSAKRIQLNPYRGSTTVQFRVTQDASVTLNLFRVGTNRAVTTFRYGQVRAGRVVTLGFTGKDRQGNPYRKGYYFFSATVTDRAQNVARSNVGGIALIPGKPVPAVTGQLLYPEDGKRIIVSLSRQALFAYEGTRLMKQTLVTTGNPALPTPLGTTTVMAKYSPYRFISPWPQGSPYWYAPSLSQYAMLFRDGGYFLHDAPWRQVFGPGSNDHGAPGTNYGGSHGCVNIPPAPMTFLFAWTTVGTRVDVVP